MSTFLSRQLTVFTSALVVATIACGGGDDEERTATPAQEQSTATTKPTSSPTSDSGLQAGDDAFPDIPLPEDANETTSVTYSGPEFVDLITEGQSAEDLAAFQAVSDFEAYTDVVFKLFEVDASQEDLVDFYRENSGDWKELLYAGPDSEDPSTLFIWELEGQSRVAWISIEETASGVSEISVFDIAVQG